ncbi:MAG: cyclase family protein [Candidatus Sabulitectum sp.]|nr:cyclase family protein [Candidatus Sabulitectum sp.]
MRKLIDVTMPLYNGISVWPGDTPFERTTTQNGDFSSSKVTMSLHTGTHMDAPRHRFKDGKTIDEIFPFIVSALVKTSGDPAGKAVLLDKPLTSHEAEELVESGVVLIGTSSNSIDHGELMDAHAIILGAGIPIIENLVLAAVAPGEYIVMAFPLKFTGADGSPVRVVLAEKAEDIFSFKRGSNND